MTDETKDILRRALIAARLDGSFHEQEYLSTMKWLDEQ